MPYYPPGPVLATIATNSTSQADNTYQLDTGVNVVFEDDGGEDIFTLYESNRNAEFTSIVGIKDPGESYPSFLTDPYFDKFLLRMVARSTADEYRGVGLMFRNLDPTGYTEIKAYNDLDGASRVSFTMGVGGSNEGAAYQNAAYFYTSANTSSMLFQVTKASGGYITFHVGGFDNEKMRIADTEMVVNDPSGDDFDFRVEGATNTHLFFTDGSADRIGINDSTPDGKLDIVQSSTTAAIPVLELEQSDLSEEFINFVGTVATGNPIEAVGAKTLTTTHFIRVAINGSFLYFPVGTIA
jgi:hypothetical protein